MPLEELDLLLVEDNDADAELLQEMLLSNVAMYFNLQHTTNLENGIKQIKSQNYDALLLDLSLPDSHGLNSFKRAKQADAELPIIVLTSTDDIKFATKIVSSGAQDYLIKSEVNPTILIQSIRYSIERKKSEIQLKKIEKNWRSILENLPSYLFATDLEGIIRYVNRVPYNLSKSEVIGNSPLPLFHDDYHDDLRMHFNQTVKHVKRSNCEVMGLNEKWFELYFGPVLNENNEIDGITIIAIDITEQKKVDQQLQLRQRMDSMGTLAGGIAHDFNNILTGIIGSLSALELERDNLSEYQQSLIRDSMLMSNRAAELVNQLQFLSKGRSGVLEKLDLYDVIDEVFSLLDKTTDKIISKRIEFNPGEIVFTGNMVNLTQVFLNLGTNAVHAIKNQKDGPSSNDYIRVYIDRDHGLDKLGQHREENVHVVFEDSGTGMDIETQKRAFEPLFTRKTGKDGQGLGLAMVYNIITTNYGGQVEIESELTEGTKFHIYLNTASTVEKDEVLNNKTPTELTLPKLNEVLVIDDEEMILNLVGIYLDRMEYTSVLVNNGKQGLEHFYENSDTIDLIILDLTMPDISGAELLRDLRSNNYDVPVIIITGHSGELLSDDLLSSLTRILPKPFQFSHLKDTIANLINKL